MMQMDDRRDEQKQQKKRAESAADGPCTSSAQKLQHAADVCINTAHARASCAWKRRRALPNGH